MIKKDYNLKKEVYKSQLKKNNTNSIKPQTPSISPLAFQDIMLLQQMVGNQVVQRMINDSILQCKDNDTTAYRSEIQPPYVPASFEEINADQHGRCYQDKANPTSFFPGGLKYLWRWPFSSFPNGLWCVNVFPNTWGNSEWQPLDQEMETLFPPNEKKITKTEVPEVELNFRWPLDGTIVIQSDFPTYGTSFWIDTDNDGEVDTFIPADTPHDGLDLTVQGNSSPPVFACEGGTVSVGYEPDGYGNYVDITHANGFVTRYAHLSSITVEDGATVTRGDQIGIMGSTGFSTSNHLHFELRLNNIPVDPRDYLPDF